MLIVTPQSDETLQAYMQKEPRGNHWPIQETPTHVDVDVDVDGTASVL